MRLFIDSMFKVICEFQSLMVLTQCIWTAILEWIIIDLSLLLQGYGGL